MNIDKKQKEINRLAEEIAKVFIEGNKPYHLMNFKSQTSYISKLALVDSVVKRIIIKDKF